MFENMTEKQAREDILSIIGEYFHAFHEKKKSFAEGDRIPFAARIYDEHELQNLVDSSLEFWLTAGKYTEEFEREFPKAIGSTYCSIVNSGSSANLLAFMALTSPTLGDKAIQRGDEVITVAAGFPTTVSPIVLYGALPVFVDITIPQYNVDVNMLEKAFSKKTKAVMVAHTLGNPFDLNGVKTFCDKHDLWLIEDNCDALGAKYTIDGKEKFTGTIGHIGTSSFYPAHHMTMGEGGAVYTDDLTLHKIMRSMRDWGRDCICPGGKDNLCGHRFDRQFGELPFGYDHKYVYSHFGYNLKVTDLQAAIGCAQLKKFPQFVEQRAKNFIHLKNSLIKLGAEEFFILPEEAPNAKASWFGFLITCKEGINRNAIVDKLEKKGIQTRNLFAGNLLRHPCFDTMRATQTGYRVIGNLENTNQVMNDTFWVGVHPGLIREELNYIATSISERP